MGKGDKKSRKGKIASGSYGVTRPRPSGKPNAAPKAEDKPTPVPKTQEKPKA